MSAIRASVLIPTHNHATTLPLTVESVLGQTVSELEILVIGDGVTPDCRTAIEELVGRDPRVRFLDFAKGPHHGEIYRHEAVLAARSDAIFYLCDDDLLLPEHVADLLALLETADFVQSRNGHITPDGCVRLFPTDLAERACVDWHLLLPRRNLTSITGSAHSREFYLSVGDPWETTPEGEWPDHYQWKKFFRRPDFRGGTSHRMTALQFPTSLNGREGWTPAQRYDELARWAAVVALPDAQQQIDRMVDRATQLALARSIPRLDLELYSRDRARADAAARTDDVRRLRDRLAGRRQKIRRLQRRLTRSDRRIKALEAELDALRRSSSWRVTSPLRKVRALAAFRRRSRRQ